MKSSISSESDCINFIKISKITLKAHVSKRRSRRFRFIATFDELGRQVVFTSNWISIFREKCEDQGLRDTWFGGATISKFGGFKFDNVSGPLFYGMIYEACFKLRINWCWHRNIICGSGYSTEFWKCNFGPGETGDWKQMMTDWRECIAVKGGFWWMLGNFWSARRRFLETQFLSGTDGEINQTLIAFRCLVKNIVHRYFY